MSLSKSNSAAASQYSVDEFAAFMDVSRLRVRSWLHAGMPHRSTTEDVIVIDEDEAMKWVARIAPLLELCECCEETETEEDFLAKARELSPKHGGEAVRWELEAHVAACPECEAHVAACPECGGEPEDALCAEGNRLNDAWWAAAFRAHAGARRAAK